jgi:hypothetical protein
VRIFFDTEFLSRKNDIEFISIGMVREDGEELHLVSSECDPNTHGWWLKKNVWRKIKDEPRMPTRRIAQMVHLFCGEKPHFWAYYADYDWVCLCNLFGGMLSLPEGWPMFCFDFQQLVAHYPAFVKTVQDSKTEHHALHDARWVYENYARLSQEKNQLQWQWN